MAENAASHRRVMKWSDYSQKLPSIYLPKHYVTALARALQNCSSAKYGSALLVVLNWFCDVDENPGEYHRPERYDISLEKAFASHPNVLAERVKLFSKYSGLNPYFVMRLLARKTKPAKKSGNDVVDWECVLSAFKAENGFEPWEPESPYGETLNKKHLVDTVMYQKLENAVWLFRNALGNKEEWVASGKVDKFIKLDTILNNVLKDDYPKDRLFKALNQVRLGVVRHRNKSFQITLSDYVIPDWDKSLQKVATNR